MYSTTADLLARLLADRIADLRTQERRFPLTEQEWTLPSVRKLIAAGEARSFLDGTELWLEPADQKPVHAPVVQLHRQRRGSDVVESYGCPVAAPAAVRAIVNSWREESENTITATIDGAPVHLSELRELVREENTRAIAAAL